MPKSPTKVDMNQLREVTRRALAFKVHPDSKQPTQREKPSQRISKARNRNPRTRHKN